MFLRAKPASETEVRIVGARAAATGLALLVAVVLGFEGALVALSASEAVKTKQGPPAALRVEMAKPPQCSIETPGQLFFL